jgi:pimeloyl-ACP methyl ester carboxylesterase
MLNRILDGFNPLRTSWRQILRLSFLAVLLLSACSSGASTPTAPGVELTDCQLSMPGTSQRVDARCGKLAVYENRAAANGRQIELNIAVVPAISRNPAPDPLIFLAGGPGEAATQSFVAVAGAFQKILTKRDIILVDQRGTGDSNPLQCQVSDSEEETGETTNEFLKSCLSKLDADPRFYTTTIAMEDLDQVRAALGIEEINLYGASYGTRAALVYLRLHPEHVRTIILDGVAPPNWTLGPSVAEDAQRALDRIFERCSSEAACKTAFPDFKNEFTTLLQKLASKDIEVSLDDPTTGEPATITLSYEGFASTIQSMSYTPETVALIPLAVHAAYSRDDFRPIAAQSLSSSQLIKNSISEGMRFSVICAEDMPFLENSPASEGYLGDFFIKSFIQICQAWPKGDIPDNFKEPVQAESPVLIISGSADPVTPPANGELAAKTLPNSLHLVVSNMGHINIYRGCLPRVAYDFIEAGSIQGLDTACVYDIDPMPFFINFSGPNP